MFSNIASFVSYLIDNFCKDWMSPIIGSSAISEITFQMLSLLRPEFKNSIEKLRFDEY